MIRRIISHKIHSITGAALVLGAASFVSRLMGLVRDRIFAHQFGAGDVLDAYYAAFRVPDLVYNLLIVGALSAGFIPVFIRVATKDKEAAWKLTSSIISILGIALVVLCSIFFLFTPQLMQFVVPGFSGEKFDSTVQLTRIMMLSPILLGLSSIASGVLQSLKSFFVYSLTPIMYNAGIIFGALVLVPQFGVVGLAYGVVIGAFLHLAVQLPSLFHHGFRYSPIMHLKDPNVREIGKLMIPRTLGLAAAQGNLLVITIIASTLTAGSLAVFNFANNLQYFPVGIIGYSFAIAAFPTLSQFVADGKKEEMMTHLSRTIRQILFFIIPVTIVIILLHARLVRVVLGTGQFDWIATITTGETLVFFSLSLFAQCLIPLLARAFFALHDTWTPFVIASVAALINIIFSLLLKDTMGVQGLALAFTISMGIQMILLMLTLRVRVGSLGESAIVETLMRIAIAAVFMTLVIELLKEPIAAIVDMTRFWGVFVQLSVAGAAGLLVYALIALALQIEEMHELRDSLKKRWLRLTNIAVEVNEADEI